MKDKILTLIIGILIGAVITAGGFLIYSKVNGNNNQQMPQMEGQMQNNGEKPDGEPPEKPDGNSTPPNMKSNNNQNTTNSENTES